MAKKVISATVTPLKADGSLDRNGLKNIFERNVRHGIDGVFLFGSMGEWGSFSDTFKEEGVELASGLLKGKADLLVGINATSLPLSLENMKRYQKYDFDLVLSGHAHGGQWRIPGILNGLYVPNQGLFPKYAGGRYDYEGGTMIVSRGLARESTPIPRIFNRPEVVIVDVK